MAGSLVAEVQLVVVVTLLGCCAHRRAPADEPEATEGAGSEPTLADSSVTPAATSTAGDLERRRGRRPSDGCDLYRDATHGFAVLVRIGDEKRVLVSGTADVAARRPVRRGDRFQIGSITKSLTSAAILAMVDDGELVPGRHGRALAARPPEARPADHRRAAAQPSQRTTGHAGSSSTTTSPSASWEPEEAGPTDLRPSPRLPTRHAVGLQQQQLLRPRAHRREGVGRGRSRSCSQERVLAPVGMSRTGLPLTYDLAVQGYAGDDEVGIPNSSLAWTAGGGVSTVEDLDRFWTGLLDGDLISRRPRHRDDHLARGPSRSGASTTAWASWSIPGAAARWSVTAAGSGDSARSRGRCWARTAAVIVLANDDESDRGRDIADLALVRDALRRRGRAETTGRMAAWTSIPSPGC